MPLRKGSSDEVISANIEELMSSGRPRRQAIKIALEKAGKSKNTATSKGRRVTSRTPTGRKKT